MRFVGVLLILAGLAVGFEFVYKGLSIQQTAANLGAFFHVPAGKSGSASQGWSGWTSTPAAPAGAPGATSGSPAAGTGGNLTP